MVFPASRRSLLVVHVFVYGQLFLEEDRQFCHAEKDIAEEMWKKSYYKTYTGDKPGQVLVPPPPSHGFRQGSVVPKAPPAWAKDSLKASKILFTQLLHSCSCICIAILCSVTVSSTPT